MAPQKFKNNANKIKINGRALMLIIVGLGMFAALIPLLTIRDVEPVNVEVNPAMRTTRKEAVAVPSKTTEGDRAQDKSPFSDDQAQDETPSKDAPPPEAKAEEQSGKDEVVKAKEGQEENETIEEAGVIEDDQIKMEKLEKKLHKLEKQKKEILESEKDIDQSAYVKELHINLPVDPSKWYDRLGKHFIEEPNDLDKNQLMKAIAKKTLQKQSIQMANEHRLLNYTLSELLELPSDYKRGSEEFSPTTVILNHWKRESLEAQLLALLDQSLLPQYVWVCLFNSDREEYYRKIVSKYKDQFHGNLFIVASDFNFKYYGRFQLALQAQTKYVWIIDDDILPGSHFLEILTHVGGIKDLKGAFGSVGWLMPHHEGVRRSLPSYREPGLKGGLYFPDMRYRVANQILTEADLLCSQWFLETDSVRLLFREQWVTFDTAEDYHLAYSLRKFANSPSYVLPMDLTDSRTWGNTDLEQNLQAVGATTTMSMVKVRVLLWRQLVARGGEYYFLKHKERHLAKSRVLVLVDSPAGLKAALDLYPLIYQVRELWDTEEYLYATAVEQFKAAIPKLGGKKVVPNSEFKKRLRTEVFLAFPGTSDTNCQDFFEKLRYEQKQIADVCSGRYYGVYNLRLGHDYPMAMRGRDIYMNLVQSISEVLKNSNIGGVLRFSDHSTIEGRIASDAAKTVSEIHKIPVLSIPYSEAKTSPWIAGLPPEILERLLGLSLTVMLFSDAAIDQEAFWSFVVQLRDAHYMGDKVDVVFVAPAKSLPPMFVENSVDWPHGNKLAQIKLRSKLSFIQILESWTPTSTNDYLILWEEGSTQAFAMYYTMIKLLALARDILGARSSGMGTCINFQGISENVLLFSYENWQHLHSKCKEKVCSTQEILDMLKEDCQPIDRLLSSLFG